MDKAQTAQRTGSGNAPSVDYVRLGQIMLKEAGAQACQNGYGTTDPEWVGRYALSFGDMNEDGSLN